MMNEKQVEALKLAREALKESHPEAYRHTIAAIDEALADNALDKMADNAKELGLDYEPIVEQVEDSVGMGHGAWDMVEPKKLAKAFHEALAEQPAPATELRKQQEPVGEAYLCDKCQTPFDGAYYCPECGHNTATKEPIYASPPASKPWVGLTDEQISNLWCEVTNTDFVTADTHEFARAIEAKLKEKNT